MATDSSPVGAVAVALREHPVATDQAAIGALLAATEMFTAAEIDIAVSLLDAPASEGYRFIFMDYDARLAAFACFGLIPGTDRSYDLYWIAVHPVHQGRGFGRQLLAEVERTVGEFGGDRLYVDTSGRPQYAPTRNFYRATGYDVVAELPDFYRQGDGKTIYCKLLGPVQDKPV